jgi:hypothetical protein
MKYNLITYETDYVERKLIIWYELVKEVRYSSLFVLFN